MNDISAVFSVFLSQFCVEHSLSFLLGSCPRQMLVVIGLGLGEVIQADIWDHLHDEFSLQKERSTHILKFNFYSADISVDVKVKLIVEIVALQNHLS